MRLSKKYAIYVNWASPLGIAHEIQIGKLHIRWCILNGGWFTRFRPWRRLTIDWLKAPDDARDPIHLFKVNRRPVWHQHVKWYWRWL